MQTLNKKSMTVISMLQFYDSWKALCDWLDESERKLKKYTSNAPSKVKQDIDELKVIFGITSLVIITYIMPWI